MIKIDIKHRFTGEVKFTAEIDCNETDSMNLKLGLAVKWAVKNKKDLRGAYLGGAYMRGADLGGANLGGANLGGADLGGANLGGAYMRGADLGGANLGGAYMREADLGGAYLRGAYLGGAYMRGADLGGANLGGADLGGAYLGGANLGGAYLGEADGKKIVITGERSILQIGLIGSRKDYLIAYSTDHGTLIQAGCWTGSLDEFEIRVKKEHSDNKFAKEYAAAIAFIKATTEIWKEEKQEEVA